MQEKIELGATAKDKITGFSGVVTGRCSYITGCDQLLIQPPIKDGAWVESRWIDDNRLEADESVDKVVIDFQDEVGACCPAPIK